MSQKDKIIFGDKGIWTPRPVFRSVCDAAAAPSFGAAQTGLEFSVSRRLADTVWPLGEEAPGKAATVPPGRMRGRPCPLGGSAYRLQLRVYVVSQTHPCAQAPHGLGLGVAKGSLFLARGETGPKGRLRPAGLCGSETAVPTQEPLRSRERRRQRSQDRAVYRPACRPGAGGPGVKSNSSPWLLRDLRPPLPFLGLVTT